MECFYIMISYTNLNIERIKYGNFDSTSFKSKNKTILLIQKIKLLCCSHKQKRLYTETKICEYS